MHFKCKSNTFWGRASVSQDVRNSSASITGDVVRRVMKQIHKKYNKYIKIKGTIYAKIDVQFFNIN